MIVNELTKRVAKIAQSNKEGMTLSINSLEPIKTGFVASYAATQNTFSETDLQSVVNHALSHDGVVGKWFNDKDGKYYYDSNKVFSNLDEALKFAKENNQLSIYDLDKGETIWLDSQAVTPKKFNLVTIVIAILMIICIIAFYLSIFVTHSTAMFIISLFGIAFLPLLLSIDINKK